MPTPDWGRYEMLVLSRLDSLDIGYKELHRQLEDLRVEIARMQIHTSLKASAVGFIGGALPVVGAGVAYFLLQ